MPKSDILKTAIALCRRPAICGLAAIFAASYAATAFAQSVCLPAPRLMTTMPMGGQVGTTVEVTITGQNFEDAEELSFSHPGITAVPKVDAAGLPIANQYIVTIAADCPPGIHEARVMTRLGVSSSRAFNVGKLRETIQSQGNTSLKKAMALPTDCICNGVMTRQAVDYYSFEAKQNQRVVVDCGAKGIDSKLNPVLIVADAEGNDLLVERRGGAVDFTAPEDGTYIIKVHDLTFSGGPYYFYRLALQSAQPEQTIPRLPGTESVSSFSWPPSNLITEPILAEAEPNNGHDQPQKITLPCNISGSFFPAADVDTFEFMAKKGDVWWVEVASERLGLPTDPSIVVQHIGESGESEVHTDVVELTDIPSPVKVSSNGYSYDGPPYNAGSTDIIGQVAIKEDGIHRLHISDLFGGTRNDPSNVYRLIIRKQSPDFQVVGWALHMNLRNGDRNALSKPIALRGGSTMAIEVVCIRRDGFGEEIQLELTGLPEGVTATGLAIPAGKSRGMVLITAAPVAPRGLSSARLLAKSMIEGKEVVHEGRFASMAWPVPNAWSEIPAPRLLADIPISVCGTELAPITIAPKEGKVWEAEAGKPLTIPFVHTRRSDFSGNSISLKPLGAVFSGVPAFDAKLTADTSEVTIDLAKLKTPPGEYDLAFHGSAVAKYRYNPDAVATADAALTAAKEAQATARAAAETAAATAQTAPEDKTDEASRLAEEAAARLKAAEAAVAAAEKVLKAAQSKAAPRDIVDIVVTTPVRVRVRPVAE